MSISGEWVESGQYPNSESYLRELVSSLCFRNSHDFFRFGV